MGVDSSSNTLGGVSSLGPPSKGDMDAQPAIKYTIATGNARRANIKTERSKAGMTTDFPGGVYLNMVTLPVLDCSSPLQR